MSYLTSDECKMLKTYPAAQRIIELERYVSKLEAAIERHLSGCEDDPDDNLRRVLKKDRT